MTFIPYLISRFFYRIAEFLRHWYVKSFWIYNHFVISLLEKFDRRLALKITLSHLFEPLYQDRTIVGYILGFIFRSLRLILGVVIYTLLIIAAIAVYFAWLMVPLYIIYRIFREIYAQ